MLLWNRSRRMFLFFSFCADSLGKEQQENIEWDEFCYLSGVSMEDSRVGVEGLILGQPYWTPGWTAQQSCGLRKVPAGFQVLEQEQMINSAQNSTQYPASCSWIGRTGWIPKFLLSLKNLTFQSKLIFWEAEMLHQGYQVWMRLTLSYEIEMYQHF